MYKVKVFPLNKDGKIEFTLEELQALLDEVAREAQNTTEPLPYHPYNPLEPYITWGMPGTETAKSITYRSPGLECENCPNRPDPDKIIIGDTPCTWCYKNISTCVSSADTRKADD